MTSTTIRMGNEYARPRRWLNWSLAVGCAVGSAAVPAFAQASAEPPMTDRVNGEANAPTVPAAEPARTPFQADIDDPALVAAIARTLREQRRSGAWRRDLESVAFSAGLFYGAERIGQTSSSVRCVGVSFSQGG